MLGEVFLMTMQATVLRVQNGSLLVFDHAEKRRVRVITPIAWRFRPGNFVCIRYNGIMTFSIPPQISAESISIIPRFGRRNNRCR